MLIDKKDLKSHNSFYSSFEPFKLVLNSQEKSLSVLANRRDKTAYQSLIVTKK